MGCGKREFKYSETVAVTLGRSRWAAAGLGIATAATLLVVALTPFAASAKAALALAVAGAAWEACARIALQRGPRSVAGLRIDRTRRIEVDSARGGRSPGVLQAGCFVAPWLTIVRWRPEGARFDRTIVVLPDMIEAEAFRRLRVLLRWS